MLKRYRVSWILAAMFFISLNACVSTAKKPPAVRRLAGNGTELTLEQKITQRTFPSIFQAWSPAERFNSGGAKMTVPIEAVETPLQTLARHDLIFSGPSAFGLQANHKFTGQATGFTPQSVVHAKEKRAALLKLNPYTVMLAEIRYHDARADYLPESSPWWKRDAHGARVAKTHGSFRKDVFLLDFANDEFQNQVARQCQAVIATGVVDGCMFDWWAVETPDHIALVKKVRALIGDKSLILVNVNGKVPVHSAPYINGMFMEGFGAPFFADWKTAKENLIWAKNHLRKPSFTLFEAWAMTPNISGRNNLQLMREMLKLSLVFSDGYFLYADQNGIPPHDHGHDWYPDWQKSLGSALGEMQKNDDGSYSRQYQTTSVVFKP